ncbi:class I lanthipeptide [Niabella sp. W65]|nr:class I lanthipeptide [Niabella sp. W65]MCH7362795.1 class I lanthipeptide [Niabella sp. W65]ULT38750.1 class I lanthipeptide [Niabella sp. I65]
MKKKTSPPKKLALNKIHIADLAAMDQVRGGFTYALSLGWKCKESKAAGADNLNECADIYNGTPVGSPEDISSENA